MGEDHKSKEAIMCATPGRGIVFVMFALALAMPGCGQGQNPPTQLEKRPASEDPEKLVEKGGAFWSSPRTFLQKEVTLTGGDRFWIWPKGDVTKKETTFELGLNWRLRPGQPQPASEGEESFLAFTPFLDDKGVSVWPAQRIKLQAAAEGQLKIRFNIEEVGADGYVLCYLSKELPGQSLEKPSKTLVSNLLRLKVQDE